LCCWYFIRQHYFLNTCVSRGQYFPSNTKNLFKTGMSVSVLWWSSGFSRAENTIFGNGERVELVVSRKFLLRKMCFIPSHVPVVLDFTKMQKTIFIRVLQCTSSCTWLTLLWNFLSTVLFSKATIMPDKRIKLFIYQNQMFV